MFNFINLNRAGKVIDNQEELRARAGAPARWPRPLDQFAQIAADLAAPERGEEPVANAHLSKPVGSPQSVTEDKEK